MGNSQQLQAYINLEKILNQHKNSNSNLLILSLPGLGISHFLQDYCKKYPKVQYIDKPNQKLASFNILNPHFNTNPNALDIAKKYFNQATPQQKIALVTNQPYLINNKKLLKHNFWRHLYSHYYHPALDKKDAKILLKQLNFKITTKQFQKIYQQSQGIPQLLKFFALHPNNFDPTELDQILQPLKKVSFLYSDKLLSKFNIIRNKHLQLPHAPQINIYINFDLSFSENNQTNPNKLTKEEAQILKFMIQNNLQITKEQISDIKWGQDNYDQFSDQAIGQAIRRLRKKLILYTITTIPKVGYQLKTKNASKKKERN